MPVQGDQLVDLAINLIAAAIGGAVVWAWRRAAHTFRLRRARQMWRPFLTEETLVVIGAFSEFEAFEPSGFVGLGDAMALAELRNFLSLLGKNDLTVAYANQVTGDMVKKHLILLGGPDGNSVAGSISARLTTTLAFRRGTVAISDSLTSKLYSPSISRDTASVETDFALVYRAANPFAPERELILIAGSYGYGTWGAAQFLVRDAQKASRSGLIREQHFECLLQVDVVYRTPQHAQLLTCRSLQSHECAPDTAA